MDCLFENAKGTAELFMRAVLKFKPQNCVLDCIQLLKMTSIVKVITESGGKIDKIDFDPVFEVGGITAYYDLIDICGSDIVAVFDILKEASAIGIEPIEDGICVSVTIPDLYSEL